MARKQEGSFRGVHYSGSPRLRNGVLYWSSYEAARKAAEDARLPMGWQIMDTGSGYAVQLYRMGPYLPDRAPGRFAPPGYGANPPRKQKRASKGSTGHTRKEMAGFVLDDLLERGSPEGGFEHSPATRRALLKSAEQLRRVLAEEEGMRRNPPEESRSRWEVYRDGILYRSFRPGEASRQSARMQMIEWSRHDSSIWTLERDGEVFTAYTMGEYIGDEPQYDSNPRRESHARVKARLVGGQRPRAKMAKIGGYLDSKGNVLNADAEPTGWKVAYEVAVYRLPDVLSWMTSTAKAVVLTKGNRKGVALSYGDSLILRGTEVPRDLSGDALRREADTEAEHWLSLDIAEAEEQAEREAEAEE